MKLGFLVGTLKQIGSERERDSIWTKFFQIVGYGGKAVYDDDDPLFEGFSRLP